MFYSKSAARCQTSSTRLVMINNMLWDFQNFVSQSGLQICKLWEVFHLAIDLWYGQTQHEDPVLQSQCRMNDIEGLYRS